MGGLGARGAAAVCHFMVTSGMPARCFSTCSTQAAQPVPCAQHSAPLLQPWPTASQGGLALAAASGMRWPPMQSRCLPGGTAAGPSKDHQRIGPTCSSLHAIALAPGRYSLTSTVTGSCSGRRSRGRAVKD